MPRKRQIKPSIFSNEELGAEATDPLMMILFAALWCLADRDGRLEDRPQKVVNSFAFPYRKVDDPDGMLQWLHDHGFIVRYDVAGKRYLQIVNFVEHQKGSGIHPNEVPSVIPPMQSTYLTDHQGAPHGPPHGPPRSSIGTPHGSPKAHRSSALNSFPSLSSLHSCKNGGSEPPAEQDPIERRIWEDGVDLLVQKAKMKDESARPLLGRLAKQYGEESLAVAIAVTLAKNPVEPKGFLIGVLKQRSKPNPDAAVGKWDGTLGPEPTCSKCFDMGWIEFTTDGERILCDCGQPLITL